MVRTACLTGEILFDRRLIQRDFPALTTVIAAGRVTRQVR